MSEIDYPEDFIPIAAGIQRLPYLSPSAKFADRVMSRVQIQGASAPAAITAPPRLSVIQGGAPRHVPDSALVKSRRRQIMKAAVAVPAAIGVFVAVSVIFAQLDFLAVLLSAAGAETGTVVGVIGATAGNYFLGSDVMATIAAGSAESAMVYMVMVLGLIAGYSGIKFAAEIARRKAA